MRRKIVQWCRPGQEARGGRSASAMGPADLRRCMEIASHWSAIGRAQSYQCVCNFVLTAREGSPARRLVINEFRSVCLLTFLRDEKLPNLRIILGASCAVGPFLAIYINELRCRAYGS